MEDNLQHLMIKELSEIILRHIKSYGMPENRALEASEKILFDICSVLDGNISLFDKNSEYTPKLSFVDSHTHQEYISIGYMHELATGYYDDLLIDNNGSEKIGLSYKTGDVLIGMRARGGINLRDPKKAFVVLEEIKAAIEPVQKKFKFEIESLATTPLSKMLLETIVCQTCGTFDATDPTNVNR